MEALDSSCRIDQLLLSGEKRMAGRAHLQPDIRFGRTGFKFVSAGAGYQNFVVFGVDSFSHFNLILWAHSILSCPRKTITISSGIVSCQ
jgi:hypothetical protein